MVPPMARYLLFFLLFFQSCGFHLVLGDAQVDTVTLCDTRGCTGKKLDPLSKTISLNVSMKRAPFGTIVASRWYYLQENVPLSIRDRISDLDGAGEVIHAITLPRAGYFRSGRYRIDILINGTKKRTIGFEVGERPSPGGVSKDDTRKVSPKAAGKTDKPAVPSGEKDLLDDDI
ncbi:hypothetical protein KKF84_18815 [Myxococcota bacterium]|nr:hypothetical protein [Myxococcota bacterium]MBU1537375.1 hypothetical protein [Myxococcota bacterium]